MNLTRLPALAAIVAGSTPFGPAAPTWAQAAAGSAQPPLAVCLQSNDVPLSFKGDDGPRGFDVALSRAVAQHLGRALRIQWFVSRDDPDANLAKDANALLSDGRCDLLAEYPLIADMLAPPYAPSAKLPPFEGASPDDRRRWVKIGRLTATKPYRLDALTVVLSGREADHAVHRLADLAGLKVGVQIATLPDAIAMQYDHSELIEHVVHVPDASQLFEKLQTGTLDAAFVALRDFDAWRLRHGSSALVPSGYQHSLGFNMGFVALASNRTLVEQVDAALAALQAHDTIAQLAADSGLTYVAPRSPDIQPNVHLAALDGD